MVRKVLLGVFAVALGGILGWATAPGSDDAAPVSEVNVDDDAVRELGADEVGADDDEGDGDDTKGDDGTSGGNNTGDGDNTKGNDGTGG
ncbi:MAG TPA: hypothetical protein VE754_00015, partial [Actinomycetota bacterium]|nr:hypothetical protein [Actinomycetota bacterium]